MKNLILVTFVICGFAGAAFADDSAVGTLKTLYKAAGRLDFEIYQSRLVGTAREKFGSDQGFATLVNEAQSFKLKYKFQGVTSEKGPHELDKKRTYKILVVADVGEKQ